MQFYTCVIYTVSTKKVTPYIRCHNSDKQCQILTEFWTNNAMSNCKQTTKFKLEFGMYPQSMPTEWTHARTVRPWQSVRLDL